MKLKLEKNLVVFDIESTGLSVVKDRIVQLAIVKLFADGRPPLKRKRLINPIIPISKEASGVHGITDEMVQNEPTFKQVANALFEIINDSDLCTFNGNRFDIPMLMEEFNRAGLKFNMTDRKSIDVKRIFHRMEPRTLGAAYRFYCKKNIENAHDAMSDVEATLEVLETIIGHYDGIDCIDGEETIKTPIKNDMEALANFTKDFDNVDFAGTIKYDSNNVPVFGFGKYQSQSVVESLTKDKSYYDWIMNKGDFAIDTRNIIKDLMDKYNSQFVR